MHLRKSRVVPLIEILPSPAEDSSTEPDNRPSSQIVALSALAPTHFFTIPCGSSFPRLQTNTIWRDVHLIKAVLKPPGFSWQKLALCWIKKKKQVSFGWSLDVECYVWAQVRLFLPSLWPAEVLCGKMLSGMMDQNWGIPILHFNVAVCQFLLKLTFLHLDIINWNSSDIYDLASWSKVYTQGWNKIRAKHMVKRQNHFSALKNMKRKINSSFDITS